MGSGVSLVGGAVCPLHLLSPHLPPGGSVVTNLPAKQEMWVRSLGWEDPLEEEEAAHFSVLA